MTFPKPSPRLRLFARLLIGLFLIGSLPCPASASTPKKIVLIAGPKSHGPEGNRIHDYPWTIRLLKSSLEQSNIRDEVEVLTFFEGWPADRSVLEDAATIMVVSDGRDGDRYKEAPHLESPERIAEVDRLMKRGCGIVALHFSNFAPDKHSQHALDWYGGYFDWETNGEREWYSNITTLESQVSPSSPEHATLRGVAPFTMNEEFYFDIRFRPDDPRWTPLLRVEALPASKPNGKVVAWSVERAGGGRGFATTCGHFYDNWKHDAFRKTILNALAWTAGIEVPQAGVDGPFLTREEITKHLSAGAVTTRKHIETADETVYADRPYWYKPGHPLDPAVPASITTLPGFVAERIVTIPRELGSLTALTVDPEGRLLVAAQHEPGIHRITPPAIGDVTSSATIETLGGGASDFGWSHGLLHAFGSFYVTVSEENESVKTGIHRLRDVDGDGVFETADLILELDAAGEHGPHNLVAGPDGNSLYLICGNGTPVPESVEHRRPVRTEGIDHLMPPTFESSEHTDAGWVLRMNPDGGERELIASGLRNSYDLAFNLRGDLFTFDSDMEWDLGTPWYRPTRICHLVGGGEFGWRGGEAKWPAYYEDNVSPVVDIGPGSPTGIVFGSEAAFPAKYQHALFACDWTFATIHAVHIEPHGAGYRAEVEEFVGGAGLPVTDAVIGKDGALYFTVGGRRLGSAIYRVRYVGDETTAPVSHDSEISPNTQLRRELEALHASADTQAIEFLWPHLGSVDRNIRFAARVALEHQPLDRWRSRALEESKTPIALTALLALARQGNPEDQIAVLSRMTEIRWNTLSTNQQLVALRVYELALARGRDEVDAMRSIVITNLRALLPSEDKRVNRELARLLCHLGDKEVIDALLAIMESDDGTRPPLGSGYFTRNPKYGAAVQSMLESAPRLERMHHAQMLLWLDDGWSQEQRALYFELIADAMMNSKGGHQYLAFWERIREAALDRLPDGWREEMEQIRPVPRTYGTASVAAPKGPGREWTMEHALEVAGRGLQNRDLVNGRAMFAATGCATCHRMSGEGGAIGPDLSSLGQRFTLQDILESTIHPSRTISDQYQMTTITLADGTSLSGRIVSRDSSAVRIATDLMQPTKSRSVPTETIKSMRAEPVSTMPPGLLNALNEKELLDLLAYLVNGGTLE